MKKFFQEHMGILIAIAVGISIIGLVRNYGQEGGPIDSLYRSTFNTVTSDVLNGNGGNNNGGENNGGN